MTARLEHDERELRRLYAEAASAPVVIDAATASEVISRGRARRSRTRLRAAGVAVVAILATASTWGVARVDAGSSDSLSGQPSVTTPRPYDDYEGQPGRYQMLVGYGPGGASIHANLTLYTSWQSDNYPVLSDTNAKQGGLGVYQPTALATGTGCLDGGESPRVGKTPIKLAAQLTLLPRSTVLQPPTPVPAFGRPAVHLRLRIQDQCSDGLYRVADTPRGARSLSYTDIPKDVVVDFWVVGIHGSPVVVDTWHDTGASAWLSEEISLTKDSIRIVSQE